MSPTPDPSFVADLRSYDPSLRVRWARHRHVWLIDKKVRERQPDFLKERPAEWTRNPGRRDIWESFQDGYVVVLWIHPSELHWSKVSYWLRRADFQAQGGIEALNRRLDAEQAAEAKTVEREVDNFCETGALQLHDEIAWADGRRVSLATPPPPVVHPDGFVIQDRRVRA